LARMDVLPAPAAFAESVVTRLSRLPGDAVRLAQAMAVLGSGWSSALDVAALAEVVDSARGLQSLADEGLLQTRRLGPTESVRGAHALIRSAIYQHLPIPLRRALHARAATLVTARSAVFEHRIAAADGYQDALATELESYADELHGRRSYRLAAHYWLASAALSGHPRDRERRWLEAHFDVVLSGDRPAVHAELDAIRGAADQVRGAMVAGALAIWDRRQADAVEILSTAAQQLAEAPVDGRVKYRVSVLLAWCLLQAGRPAVQIRAALDAAGRSDAPDPALQGLATLAAGTLVARTGTATEALRSVGELPLRPEAVPLSMTPALVWRGTLLAGAGRFAEAATDLAEITERVAKGQVDINGGAMHAFLGRAQWFLGRWALARVNLRIAVELSRDYPHPMTVANAPLVAIAAGDFAAAESELRTARELIDRAPWVEAVDVLMMTEVIFAHANGSTSADLYDRIRASVRAVRDGSVNKNMLWLVHAGLAALWANEVDDAAACADIVRASQAGLAWTTGMADWLSGLVAEARGNGKLALQNLSSAVAAETTELPLYRAHALLDHARLTHLLGDQRSAAQSLESAARAYQGLGAAPYVRRVEELSAAGRTATPEPTIALSGRERDVLTLAVEGLSYAQIARDLFITQSTVSYHLGNIYAKANVASRHQLTDVVRADPIAFGLA
jgi:DNA-binding CsgD family transcriptional regulator